MAQLRLARKWIIYSMKINEQGMKNDSQSLSDTSGTHLRSYDVVLGFDMETDIGSYTPFYEGVIHGTPLILEILKKYSIPATFFWTGHAAEKNPEMVRIRTVQTLENQHNKKAPLFRQGSVGTVSFSCIVFIRRMLRQKV